MWIWNMIQHLKTRRILSRGKPPANLCWNPQNSFDWRNLIPDLFLFTGYSVKIYFHRLFTTLYVPHRILEDFQSPSPWKIYLEREKHILLQFYIATIAYILKTTTSVHLQFHQMPLKQMLNGQRWKHISVVWATLCKWTVTFLISLQLL